MEHLRSRFTAHPWQTIELALTVFLWQASTGVFLLSLVFVQWMEVTRRREEIGLSAPHVSVPASSQQCVACHGSPVPVFFVSWGGK